MSIAGWIAMMLLGLALPIAARAERKWGVLLAVGNGFGAAGIAS